MHAPHEKKSSNKSSLHALNTTHGITFLGVDHEWAAPERQRGMRMPPEWLRALHNARIGKTLNLEGLRSERDGRSSAEVAQFRISSNNIILNRSCDIARTITNRAFFFYRRSEGGQAGINSAESWGRGYLSVMTCLTS